MPADVNLIPMERIEKAILFIRGEKVMLDTDLAELYGVDTGSLNRAVKRNAELARKLAALEQKYDAQFKVVFDAIRQLMSPPAKPKREIGFHVKYDDDKPKAKKR